MQRGFIFPAAFSTFHSVMQSILNRNRNMNFFKALPQGPDHSLFSGY